MRYRTTHRRPCLSKITLAYTNNPWERTTKYENIPHTRSIHTTLNKIPKRFRLITNADQLHAETSSA